MTKKRKEDVQEATSDWSFEELDGKTLIIYFGTHNDMRVLIGRDKLNNKAYILALEDAAPELEGMH